jgi:putative flavoprotein involved in K+ transport
VVGAGNSGAEIAKELAGEREVWMAGRDVGAIPFRISGFWGRTFLVRLVLRFLFHRILTIRTPVGRKVRPTILAQGGPLIRTRGPELETMGVKRVPKVRRVVDGKPQLEDGRVLDTANVVWCTGFRTGFPDWIDLPIFGAKGYPAHEAGVVAGTPGLYFVGLHFLYSLSSAMVHGVGRDAERIARAVSRRARATTRPSQRERRRAAS